MVAKKKKNIASLKHATYKIEEKSITTGTDISTSPLAPASGFLKKGLSGKYISVFTCPNRQADFLNTTHFFYSKWPKISRNVQTICNKTEKKMVSKSFNP